MLKIIKQLISKDKQIKYLARLKLKGLFKFPTKKKNILILLRHLTNGGIERLFINLANELSLKYNVIIIVSSKKNPDFKCNVKIIEIPNLDSDKLSIKRIRYLKKVYNITHSLSGSISYNYLNVASRYKDKVIISVHNMLTIKILEENDKICNNIAKKKLNLEKRKKRIVLANEFADTIICVSKELADEQNIYFGAIKRKIKVIYNFIDFQQISKEKRLNKDKSKIIITAGRLEKAKNQSSLIEAFQIVLKKHPQAKLWILGRGSEEENLKKLIRKLKLENNVFLLGFKQNIYECLKQADIFILTSKHEGFGNVIIEAMSCSLPVISTDCSAGPREIIAPDTDYRKKTNKIDKCEYGILIPPISDSDKDETNIAQALLELLDSQKLEKYYQNQSLKRAKDFDKKIILKQWDKIFK